MNIIFASTKYIVFWKHDIRDTIIGLQAGNHFIHHDEPTCCDDEGDDIFFSCLVVVCGDG